MVCYYVLRTEHVKVPGALRCGPSSAEQEQEVWRDATVASLHAGTGGAGPTSDITFYAEYWVVLCFVSNGLVLVFIRHEHNNNKQ